MLKTRRFFTFFIFGKHLEGVILYCVGQVKIKTMVFSAGETIIFFTPWEKSLEMPVNLRNPMPKRLRSIFSQLCHKDLGSSSKMELAMEALFLHWKLRVHFQRFSLIPPWDFVFLDKSDWLPFLQTLPCGVKLLGPCDHKA